MNEIPIDDAFLQVNDDQRGIGVKRRQRHRISSSNTKLAGMKQAASGSIVNEPCKQFQCTLELLLLLG
jgi:hypothetical protein